VLSYRPVTSRALAKVLRRPLNRAAEEIVEISPPVVRRGRAAVFLPGELERFTGTHPGSDVKRDHAAARGMDWQHGPSHAYLLRNALIADGCLLTRDSVLALNSQKRRWRLPAKMPTIAEGALCSTQVTERYFGHWLYDGLSHEQWARDRSLLPLTLCPPENRTHEPGYRALADMPAQHVDNVVVDRLWYLEDHELTDDRIARVKRIRDRIRSKATGGGPSHVYIGRGVTGVGREIVNEREVADCLQRRGVVNLEPEKTDPQTIVDTLANAKVVISVEGSATGHAIIAAPSDAMLVTLFPPTHMNMLFKGYADALGFGFAIGVGESVSQEQFRMPTDRLAQLLDLVSGSPA